MRKIKSEILKKNIPRSKSQTFAYQFTHVKYLKFIEK